MTRATVSRIFDTGAPGIGASYSTFWDGTGTKYVSSWTATDTWRVLNSSAGNAFTQETKDGHAALKCGGLQDSSFAYMQVQFARPGYTVSGSALTLGVGQETLSLLVWAADPMNLSTIQSLIVYLDGGAGVDGTNYLTSSATSAVTAMLGGGWFLLTWNLRQMSTNGTASTCWANLNRGKIWSVAVRLQNGNDTNGDAKTEAWIGGIYFGGRVRPRLVLGFDGCYISQKNRILPDLQAIGVPGTLYVTRHKLGSGATYLTESDLDTFHAAGWAIAQHSNTYSTGYDNATNFPDAQAILDDIGDFQEWQRVRGWTRGLGHACWPYTDLTVMTLARRALVSGAMRTSGLRTIRTTAAGIGTSICGRANGLMAMETALPTTLYSPQMVNGLTPAQAMTYIKNTAGMGMHAHLYAHEVTVGGTAGGDGISNPVGSNYWLKSDWDAFLPLLSAAIKQGLIDPGTIGDCGY